MLWICLGCTTAYSVGAEACPHCGRVDYAEDGTEEARMAKISRHVGATVTGVTEPRKREPKVVAGPAEVAGDASEEQLTEEVLEQLQPAAVVVDPSTGVEVEGPDDAPNGPYAAMLRTDLQRLCSERGLVSYGSKAELVARLVDDDETRPGPEVDVA